MPDTKIPGYFGSQYIGIWHSVQLLFYLKYVLTLKLLNQIKWNITCVLINIDPYSIGIQKYIYYFMNLIFYA